MQYIKYIAKFFSNTSGSIPTFAGISLIPLIASVGLGIDYSAISVQKAELQQVADAEALERRGGRWISDTIYQVDKNISIPTYFMGIVGLPNIGITVTAQSEIKDPHHSFDPGDVIPLKGDASDYNISGVYCFNPKTNERHSFTDIADNRDGSFSKQIQSCKKEESVEFYLKNYNRIRTDTEQIVRAGQNGGTEIVTQITHTRENLSSPCSPSQDSSCTLNVFYSDNGNKNNIKRDGVNVQNAATETVICDSVSDCILPYCSSADKSQCIKYTWMGGKVPSGTMRQPVNERHNCEPGKHIYFAWEDTPVKTDLFNPDFDYNDFAMVMSCPKYGQGNGRFVYLRR